MSDVVWVACISAGGAIFVGIMTQYLATLAASKQADRQDKTALLQWQRTEASVLQERRQEVGREFWALILASRRGLQQRIRSSGVAAAPQSSRTPAEIAGDAYAIALRGLLEPVRVMTGIFRWSEAYRQLEDGLAARQSND